MRPTRTAAPVCSGDKASPRAVVVSGAAGSGKTTLATMLSERLGWTFTEGDDHHSAENVAKMRAGMPLTDRDRDPWLSSISSWITRCGERNEGAVVSCSALRRVYREVLRRQTPNLRFVQLMVSEEVLVARVAARHAHYMPPTLVQSQVALLEPLTADERGITIDGHQDRAAIVDEIALWLERAFQRPRWPND